MLPYNGGIAVTAFVLGMRHAFDADHIAASVLACGNSMRSVDLESEGIFHDVSVVPAAVAHLATRQLDGWCPAFPEKQINGLHWSPTRVFSDLGAGHWR
ncbi:MAG: hypothetical protein ACYCZY_10650 [Lacisediminihabitans sp.]